MNVNDWEPEQYLKFEKERTQPSIDLAARIRLKEPKRIIDIGCGPGNSTMVLKKRWPRAAILGLDSSESMLQQARSTSDDVEWIRHDTANDLAFLGKFDIVFSNAAVHHMPDKPQVLARFFDMLNPAGVLAVQVPDTRESAFAQELQKLVQSGKWNRFFAKNEYPGKFHGYSFYYEILCGLTNDLEIWQTDYIQRVSNHADIVQWYKGSGLRFHLSALPKESDRIELLADYEKALEAVYSREKDGMILHPMRRLFFVAYKRTLPTEKKTWSQT